jgi:hypothetical protein
MMKQSLAVTSLNFFYTCWVTVLALSSSINNSIFRIELDVTRILSKVC